MNAPVTPSYTLDRLDEAAKSATRRPGEPAAFVSVDARVLDWLIQDSRNLHAITEPTTT